MQMQTEKDVNVSTKTERVLVTSYPIEQSNHVYSCLLIFPSYIYTTYMLRFSAHMEEAQSYVFNSLYLSLRSTLLSLQLSQSSQKRFLSFFFLYVPSQRNSPKPLRVISPPFYEFLKSTSCLLVSLFTLFYSCL